jgi:hypothetical protein
MITALYHIFILDEYPAGATIFTQNCESRAPFLPAALAGGSMLWEK